MVVVKNQVVTKRWSAYCDDCCNVTPAIPEECIGFSIFSPPFCSLYSYSDSDQDMGNARTNEEFFHHFDFLVKQLFRITMPGRIVAVHAMDLPTFKNKGEEIGTYDFPGDINKCFLENGFIRHARITIWKDPLIAATRTHAINLAHQQLVKDSAMSGIGIPDTILAFRKPGENPKPITHPKGLTEYAGSRPIPKDLDRYIKIHQEEHGKGIEKNPYNSGKDKRSHYVWQQYASPVWFDIRQTRVLPYVEGKDKDDQRHICPLQRDTVSRCLTLWSAKGDIVFTPFMGVGTEIYEAVSIGRKGIGIELKRSYFKQAIANLKSLEMKDRERRFSDE